MEDDIDAAMRLPTPEELSAWVATIAAGIVYIEYTHRKRQGRLQRANDLERRYDEDPILRFAVLCLDWGAGALPVSAEYVAYVGASSIDHDLELLRHA